TGWGIPPSCVSWISSGYWWRRRSSSRAGSGGGFGPLGGISRRAVFILASLAVSACRSANQNDVLMMTKGCTTHVRAKGPTPQLPRSPSLAAGFGGVVGTLGDSGGALPHYRILAATPGDAPSSLHASAIADSVGGVVFGGL